MNAHTSREALKCPDPDDAPLLDGSLGLNPEWATLRVGRRLAGGAPVDFYQSRAKRALYAAILAEKANLTALVDAIDDVARKRDDERVFSLIASYRIRPGADPTMLRLLLFSGLEGHELADMFFSKQHRVMNDYLAGYIRTRIEEGAFRPVDPLLAARAFIGMVVHHRLLHEIYRQPMHRSHEETVETYVELFLTGLVKRTGRAGKEPARCR